MRWQGLTLFSLLVGSPLIAGAVTVGDVSIQSTQNQPLVASIALSNIDVNNTKVTLANANVYQKYGLTASSNLQVRFEKTGNSSGQLVITSQQPITAPFVDVLVAVAENNVPIMVPKTLLLQPPSGQSMALSEPTPVSLPSTAVVMPMVADEPLEVTQGLPPPLSNTNNQPVTAKAESDKATESSYNYKPNVTTGYDPQVLATQIARVYTSKVDKSTQAALPVVVQSQPVDVLLDDDTAFDENSMAVAKPAQQNHTQNQASVQSQPNNRRYTYNVKRHDNLWQIASGIAEQRGISINQVMDSIQALNPKAFVRGNANLLKETAVLTIPTGNEMPSLARQQASVRAQQVARLHSQSNQASNKAGTKTSVKKPATKSAPTTVQATPKPAAKTEVTMPEMTLVTPEATGKAEGDSQTVAKTQQKLPPQIVDQLKQARLATAEKAKSVNKLNTELSSFEQKLKLQNAKLAELEARLKKLQQPVS